MVFPKLSAEIIDNRWVIALPPAATAIGPTTSFVP
jgi:hypothetical protein